MEGQIHFQTHEAVDFCEIKSLTQIGICSESNFFMNSQSKCCLLEMNGPYLLKTIFLKVDLEISSNPKIRGFLPIFFSCCY